MIAAIVDYRSLRGSLEIPLAGRLAGLKRAKKAIRPPVPDRRTLLTGAEGH
jgi:hypothetical protein